MSIARGISSCADGSALQTGAVPCGVCALIVTLRQGRLSGAVACGRCLPQTRKRTVFIGRLISSCPCAGYEERRGTSSQLSSGSRERRSPDSTREQVTREQVTAELFGCAKIPCAANSLCPSRDCRASATMCTDAVSAWRLRLRRRFHLCNKWVLRLVGYGAIWSGCGWQFEASSGRFEGSERISK